MAAIMSMLVLAIPAFAEEHPTRPVHVRGLVVSSRDGLTLNDGTRDYLLLGVDDIGIEGRVCIIFGDLVQHNGRSAIDVFEVRLISEEDQFEDRIGRVKDRHILARTASSLANKACQSPQGVLVEWGLRDRILHLEAGRWINRKSSYPSDRLSIAPSHINTAQMAPIAHEQHR